MLILEVLHLDQGQLLLPGQPFLVQLTLHLGIKHSILVTFIITVVFAIANASDVKVAF